MQAPALTGIQKAEGLAGHTGEAGRAQSGKASSTKMQTDLRAQGMAEH